METSKKGKKRDWKFMLIVGAAVFVVASVVQSIIYLIVSKEGFNISESGELTFEPIALLLSVLSSNIFGLSLLTVFLLRKNYLRNHLTKHPIEMKKVLQWALLAVLLVVIKEIAFRSLNIHNSFLENFLEDTPPVFLTLLVFGFTGPVFEEFLYRLFLYDGIKQTKLGERGAIIITASVFAFSHLQYSMYLIGFIFVFGLVYGICRYKTKNIIYPVLMHITVNFSDTLLAIL